MGASCGTVALMALQDNVVPSREIQQLVARTSRSWLLVGVLAVVALMLGSACGGSRSENAGGGPDHDELDLSEFGSGFGDIVNRQGDVASIYSIGTGDYASGSARAGAVLYRLSGEQQRVILAGGTAVSTWGAVGNDFLLTTYPCSTPDNFEGDCKEEDRSPTGALLIDEAGQTTEIALPPNANQVGRFLSNTGDVAIFQGADSLVTYDLAADTWATVDGQGHMNSTTSFACPNLGLIVSSGFTEEESGVTSTEGSGAVVKSFSADGESVVGDAPVLRESKVEPVACVDDGIVFQTEGGFDTMSNTGKVAGSAPYPSEVSGGLDTLCQPVAGPVPTAVCTTFGDPDAILVVDVGLPSQQAIPAPSLNQGPIPHALVPTGDGEDKFNLILSDGEAVEVSR